MDLLSDERKIDLWWSSNVKRAGIKYDLSGPLAIAQKQWDMPQELFSKNGSPTVKLDDPKKYM